MNNNKPDLFIIDLDLKLKKKLDLIKLLKKRKTFIITKSINKKKISLFKKKGFKIINIKSLYNKNDFQYLIKKLFELGYSRVFFETGLTFLNELIKKDILNSLYLFRSSQKLYQNGLKKIPRNLIKKMSVKTLLNVNLKRDTLDYIKIKN